MKRVALTFESSFAVIITQEICEFMAFPAELHIPRSTRDAAGQQFSWAKQVKQPDSTSEL